MTLNDFLHRYEGIVLKKSEEKTELLCEFLPIATWYLFKTNHGRYFTCKDSFKNSESNVGKNGEMSNLTALSKADHILFNSF